MRFIKLIRYVLFLSTIIFLGCKNNLGSDPNTEALLLEFGIQEIPDARFEINNQTGIVKIANLNSIQIASDIASLTAEFIASDGATVTVEENIQTSGKNKNSFENGLYFTVTSEDSHDSKDYFVHLEDSLPAKYFFNKDFELEHNPSGKAPLSAFLAMITRVPTKITMEVTGEIGIKKEFSSSTIHLIGIHGLYADKNNIVNFTFEDESGLTAVQEVSIQTDPLPDFMPEIEINVLNETEMEPGMHFSEVHIGNQGVFDSYPLIFDNNGDIRWFVDLSAEKGIVWPIQFNNDMTFYSASGVTIHEFSMFGNSLDKIIVDFHDMHHEIIKLPNGNYVVAVSKDDKYIIDNDGIERLSAEDFIIEVDRNTGEIITEWDMAEILDVNRGAFSEPKNGDWFHMNAVWYDETDNSLIVSGRNQGLVKVNWENELQWILAPHKGWGKAGRTGEGAETSPFLLTALDATGNPFNQDIQDGTVAVTDFDWVWGQHAPMILPNGNLLVFDNGGFNRNFGNFSKIFSAATEYEIDEQNKTVKEVWSYGKERGESTYSLIISDVDYLPETGNRIFAPGNITEGNGKSKIVEVSYPNKEVVFESTMFFKNQLGTGSGFGNIDISYRAERVFLYR